jgi:nucleoid DNA-binding protein
MYSLVDLILMKDRSLKRDDVQSILTLTTDVIRENLQEGKDVLWVDLCTFTWKVKAKTKKEAALYAENPELAKGEKIRIEPANGLDNLDASGGIIKESKRKKKDETIKGLE